MKGNGIKFFLFFFFFSYFSNDISRSELLRNFEATCRGKKFWGYISDMNDFKSLKRRECPNFKKK